MSHSKLAAAFSLIVVAASPVPAQPAGRDAVAGAPTAGPDARYCLRVRPVTGTLSEQIQCWTRRQWADQGVDVDKVWAREGVKILE